MQVKSTKVPATMKDKAISMTLGKRRLFAALAVWLLVQSAGTITGVVRAGPTATSPRPAWNSEVRQVKVATPTGEQVKEITFQKNSLRGVNP